MAARRPGRTLPAMMLPARTGRTLLLLVAAARAATATGPAVHHESEAARLVNEWHAAGTAAGKTGDFYDNRDGGHSPLNLAWFPQVQPIQYSDAERQQRRDWALATGVRPGVVVGNSSTSASVRQGGSNPRHPYTSAGGEIGRAHV